MRDASYLPTICWRSPVLLPLASFIAHPAVRPSGSARCRRWVATGAIGSACLLSFARRCSALAAASFARRRRITAQHAAHAERASASRSRRTAEAVSIAARVAVADWHVSTLKPRRTTRSRRTHAEHAHAGNARTITGDWYTLGAVRHAAAHDRLLHRRADRRRCSAW